MNVPRRKEMDKATCFEIRMQPFEDIIGKILTISPVYGGLVNHIYRVDGEQGFLYAKIRKTEFSSLPHLKIDPEDIKYESKALSIFSAAFPDVFPTQFVFYPQDSMIIMDDAIRGGCRLDDAFRSGNFSERNATELGRLIGEIHRRFENEDTSIREDGDSEYYEKNLEYRLGYHNNSELDALVQRLRRGERQLILGDLSPKNIAIGNDGRFTMWDLEMAHRGNTVFDIGFLAAHVILHCADEDASIRSIDALFNGYNSVIEEKAIVDTDLKQVVLGIILYRMCNEVIPYLAEIGSKERRQISESAFLLLGQEDPSWTDIVRCSK